MIYLLMRPHDNPYVCLAMQTSRVWGITQQDSVVEFCRYLQYFRKDKKFIKRYGYISQ